MLAEAHQILCYFVEVDQLSWLILAATRIITAQLKPGFHYPSWRPELTGDWFPLPVNTARVDG